MRFSYYFLLLILISCAEKKSDNSTDVQPAEPKLTVEEKYYADHANDSLPSISHGTVSNGSIENATLIPYEGSNYCYFDRTSYLGGRAFTNSKVAQCVVETYRALESQGVTRKFKVMEFSKKEGGKIFPHRTHQNGMSVDFMMPLMKDGKPYYGLDEKGASHYLLEFDRNGAYSEDPSITIDFDMVAQHLLTLDKEARKQGLKIHKVIFNTSLKDELYASSHGQKLLSSGIYVTRNLEKLINDLHDDHYHVDFAPLR